MSFTEYLSWSKRNRQRDKNHSFLKQNQSHLSETSSKKDGNEWSLMAIKWRNA